MTTIAVPFLVHDENLAGLRKAIERLARRAAKLGLPGPTIEVGAVETSPADKDGFVLVRHHVTVSGESPCIAGWTVLAMLDHVPGGVIVRRIGTGEVPERYRAAHMDCDHCRVRRDRVSTYVLVHEDGRYAQIGSSCLADFTGHPSPEDLANAAEYLAEAIELAEDAGESCGFGRSTPTLETYLTFVSAAITRYGFLSRKVADERNLRSTATTAIAWMSDGKRYAGRLGAIDMDRAKRAIAWALLLEPRGDYEHNLRVIARGGIYRDRDAGIAASMVAAYDRAMDAARAAVESTVVGEVGKMLELVVEVTRAQDTGGRFAGIRYFLRDESGNVLVWKSSSGALEVGGRYKLRGKVTSHEPYVNRTTGDSTQQTALKLCKVLETLHSPKAVAAVAYAARRAEDERRYQAWKAAREEADTTAHVALEAAVALAGRMGIGPTTREQDAEVEAAFLRASGLRVAAEALRNMPPVSVEDDEMAG